METSSTIRYIGFRRNSKLETSATSSRPFASCRHKADGWSNSTLPGQPRISGRAFKYLTQPTRTDFNLRRVKERSHPERSAAKSKDPARLAVSCATGFLDFARNDTKYYTHASSADRGAARVPFGRCI